MFSRTLRAFLLISFCLMTGIAYAGKVELSTYYPAPFGEYSELNVTKSFIPPRMSTGERDLITAASTPPLAQGMVIYNTTTNQLEINRSADTAVSDWAPLSTGSGGGFSNFQMFGGNGTFTVPDGVTKIMAEVWGGGGGGSAVGVGCGGGYGKSILAAMAGENLAVVVGSGGAKGTYTTAYPGKSSYVSRGATLLIRATGGGGAAVCTGGIGDVASFSIMGGGDGISGVGGQGANGGSGGDSPSSPGGGGGGKQAGASGRVVIWW